MASITSIPEPLSAQFPESFAYFTVKERLPVILTKVIDALAREKEAMVQKYGKMSKEELKDVIGRLSKLKSDIQTDKPLPLIEDGREDAALWNACILEEKEKTASEPSWFKSAWLLVECYMYRKIKEAFELSPSLRMHDPFSDQKEEDFQKSMEAEIILIDYLWRITRETCGQGTLAEFTRILQLDLWGNKCDLSISVGVENSKKTNPLEELASLESYILVDSTEKIWNSLQRCKAEHPNEVRVDFVLDNAGFELFCDLCFADYLCSKNIVQYVVFHVKEMPWFVSDTTPEDFQWMLGRMRNCTDQSKLMKCTKQWDEWIKCGRWRIHGHHFWTTPHDFSSMIQVAPSLYHELSLSHLLIFKGDLNYRKLTGDRNWEHTIPFGTALRGFQPTALCTLRTLKADVVVGLLPGQAEHVRGQQERWMISGDYAVIQFYQPGMLD